MTESRTANRRTKNRRRRKCILPHIQVTFAMQTLFIALPILTLNFLMTYSDALAYQRSVEPPLDAAAVGMASIIFHDFLIATAIAIPFSIAVGILISFPFCGPVYRFGKFFSDLRGGRWDQLCTLRDGDRLHDLKENINDAVRMFSGHLYRQHELLREARTALGAGGAPERSELIAAIDEELAQVAPRFGEAGEPSSAPSTEATATAAASRTA